MRITFGDQTVEVRPWGGEGSGKVLLMTRDPRIKGAIMTQMYEFPEAFEHLAENAALEDAAGLWLIVADARKVGIFFDMEKMKAGFCVCEETEEDESEE